MSQDGVEFFGIRLYLRKTLAGELQFVLAGNGGVIGGAEEEIRELVQDAVLQVGWPHTAGQGWDRGRRRRGRRGVIRRQGGDDDGLDGLDGLDRDRAEDGRGRAGGERGTS